MSTILITGASGTLGADVSGWLELHRPDLALRRATSRPSPPAGWVEFDFLKPETFPAALHGVTRVFLLRPPALAEAEGHFGPFLDALKAQPGLEAVVLLSLQGADRNPAVPHHHLEKALDRRGLPRVFLRPSFFFQNLSGIHAAEIRTEDRLVLCAGRGATAFVDTRDLAEGAGRILAAPEGHLGKAYEWTGRGALTYAEVAAELSRQLGRTITYQPVGALRFYRDRRRRGVAAGQALVMTALYSACRWGTAAGWTTDLGDFLGRPPRGLEDFVRDHRTSWEPS